MKKSLIALAVLAASGAVMAQSSVTLYGVADVSLAKSGATASTVTFSPTTGVGAVSAIGSKNKTEMSSGGLMNNGTSRLGVRGTEDIGGGLKVSFNYEQQISNETGVTPGFQRQAWVSVDGGFGGLRLGRAFTPSYRAVTTWELTGAANYSVVANSFGYNGNGLGFTSFSSRDNSQFTYTTPTLGGFTGQVSYIFKQDNPVTRVNGVNPAGLPTVETVNEAKYDLALMYVNGPLAASFAYNKIKGVDANSALGAAYDFGSFKVAGSLQSGFADQKGFTIGATVPMGAFSFTFDVARDTEYKDTDYLLEAKYAMSKRTFLYAAYLRDGDKKVSTTTGRTGNVVTSLSTTATKSNFGLGIRHNF